MECVNNDDEETLVSLLEKKLNSGKGIKKLLFEKSYPQPESGPYQALIEN